MIYGIKNVIRRIRNYYVLGETNAKWRKYNKHNMTSLGRRCNFDNIKVGNYTYGVLNVHDFQSSSKLVIGNFCSIAEDVHFLLAGEHNLKHISSYPFKKNIFNEGAESISKGNITVEDDVWIGMGAYILSGVTIGKGSVIAAGAVVVKDIPRYSIAAGVPAKPIQRRFNNETSELLERLDYGKINSDYIYKHKTELLSDCAEDSIEVISAMIKELEDGKE